MSEVLTRSYIDFETRRTIVEKVVDRRLGFENPNPPTGWSWDSRHLMADKIAETLPNPGLTPSHLLGIPREYWQNGPLTGKDGPSVEVEEIASSFVNGKERWCPKIRRGDVSIWRDGYYLFSDDSVVELYNADSVDATNRSVHTLAKEVRPGTPISVAIYKRNDLNESTLWRFYSKREYFTGLLDDDDSVLTTKDGDIIYWANVDTDKREFLTFLRSEGIYLQFNRNITEQITKKSVPVVILDFNDLEYLGTSTGTNDQTFFSKVFPVSDDTYLHCYVVNTVTNTWTEYSVVSTFSAANQVIVDYDIGSFLFGNSTGLTPAPTNNLAIYISYNAVPRIEYEEYGYSDYLLGKEADVNPLGQSLNKGFVVIGRSEQDISSIVLSTTEEVYTTRLDTYGPVYIGADYATLLAHVYASDETLVPNAEVTFTITSSVVGSLGGSGNTAERRTDYRGVARTYYTPPVSVEDIGFFATTVGVGNTITIAADAEFEDVDDVYTYYVLKDDPWKGKAGANTAIGEIEWSASPPNGRRAVFYKWSTTAINPITGRLGAYVPVRPASITGGNVLTYIDTLAAPDSSSTGANLGAYWVVSDRYVSIRASVYSPRTRQTIYSNIISFKVQIPLYMRGEYIKQNLDIIPFGFRIKDDTYEVASALNGATYICINPIAGPWPIIDVISGETWDPYSDFWPYGYGYPKSLDVSREFATVSFCFTVA